MSDPVTSDYTSVTALTEREQRRAVLRTTLESDGTRAELEMFLDMLGLTGMANEIRAERGLSPLQTVSLAPGGRRDSVGRLRTSSAPAAPVPAPFTPVPCQSGRHMKTEPGRCRDCKNASKRAQRARNSPSKRTVLPRGEVDADGRRPCGTGEHDLNVDGKRREDNGTWFCEPCAIRRRSERAAADREAREVSRAKRAEAARKGEAA